MFFGEEGVEWVGAWLDSAYALAYDWDSSEVAGFWFEEASGLAWCCDVSAFAYCSVVFASEDVSLYDSEVWAKPGLVET